MINRSIPSEEYRRRLRERHILEWFCLAVAGVMLILGVIFLLDIDRSLWIPEAIAVLGGILNFGLAVRAAMVRFWAWSIGLFFACGACYGLLAWLNWT